MAEGAMNMPGGMGGLMRFSEEYTSKFNLKPVHVLIFIIAIVIFRISLNFFVKI